MDRQQQDQDQEHGQDQDQGPGSRAAAIYLTVTGAMELAYLTYQIWLILPEHQRQALRMKIADRVRRLAGRGARRAGAASIETELRTGMQLYALPFWLSRLRDRAADFYNREKL